MFEEGRRESKGRQGDCNLRKKLNPPSSPSHLLSLPNCSHDRPFGKRRSLLYSSHLRGLDHSSSSQLSAPQLSALSNLDTRPGPPQNQHQIEHSSNTSPFRFPTVSLRLRNYSLLINCSCIAPTALDRLPGSNYRTNIHRPIFKTKYHHYRHGH